MGFAAKFEDRLMDIADFVDNNVYLSSIKGAFTDYVPFIIVGSFGTLLSSLISSTTTGLAQWIPALANLAPAFSAMSFAAISCMTIPIIFLIALHLAKEKKMQPFITAILCVISYLCMVPNVVTVTIEEAAGSTSGLGSGVLGAQGLFIGMLVAVLITNLFQKLTSIEKIKIKMPDSVPQGIAVSFNILIPVFIIIVISAVFGTVFQILTGSYINEFIYNVVQAPLSAVVQTTPGIVIMAVVCQLFWFLGIHGGLVVGICGIGEPMVFGLPLVLNPTFAIPFILNSGIAAAIALGAIQIGFINCSTVDAPFGLPLFINAALSYGWKGAIVQLVILVVGTLTYIPFVLMSNRMAQKEAEKKEA